MDLLTLYLNAYKNPAVPPFFAKKNSYIDQIKVITMIRDIS